jgi:hypothetical protein
MGLTNVEQWLQFSKLAADFVELIHRAEGVRVVVTEHPPVGSQGLQ